MSAQRFVRPRGVAIVECEVGADDALPRLYLAHLPDGPLVVLEGTAAIIWQAAIVGGAAAPQHWSAARPDDGLVALVAEETGVPPDGIRTDVLSFLRDLVEQGLLEPTTATLA